MKKTALSLVVSLTVGSFLLIHAQNAAHWPQWRGPFFNGMARGDAPTT